MPKRTESCGRCAMTSVVSIAESRKEDPESDRSSEEPSHPFHSREKPFDGAHIEVEEETLRLVSLHSVVAGRIKRRLNDWATRIIYGT